jgi:hypothetical protein
MPEAGKIIFSSHNVQRSYQIPEEGGDCKVHQNLGISSTSQSQLQYLRIV